MRACARSLVARSVLRVRELVDDALLVIREAAGVAELMTSGPGAQTTEPASAGQATGPTRGLSSTATTSPGVQFHDLLTVFLDATHGSGGILSVINGVGRASTAANADQPVDVVSYP